jgi:stage V sporulation protein G
MPSRRDEKGVFRDIVHPITQEARQKLEETILNAYYEYLVKNPEPSHPVSFSQKV